MATKKKLIVAAAIFLVLAVLAAIYVKFIYIPDPEVFGSNTVINKVNVSGMTKEQAKDALTKAWNSHDIVYVCDGDKETLSLEGSGIKYDIDPDLDGILSRTTFAAKLKDILKIKNDIVIFMKPKGSEEFDKRLRSLDLCDNTDRIRTENAKIDLSDTEFRIIKEKVGTETDPELVKKKTFDAISLGLFVLEFDKDDIVRQPEITSDSEELLEKREYYKNNYSYRLSYKADGEDTILSPKDLKRMVSYKNGKAKIRKEKLQDFVDDLAEKYNEYGKTYEFITHYGSPVSVHAVTFGRYIDKDGEYSYWKKALKKQESDTHELIWAQKKYKDSKEQDGISDSYIEVSIANQHVWCYKNGKCIVSCDCVTGKPGHDTSRGVFTVQWVSGPMILRGKNDDGTEYESPVNCFIPFYAGQGLHGSNGWRHSWGGVIYKTNGSHGCVNCPDGPAKQIANAVCAGYPVVIY